MSAALSVADSETLSRFVLDRSAIRSSDGTVKHTAFLPPKANPTVSVYRTTDLVDANIWSIGREFVGVPRQKTVLGRADVLARAVRAQGLDVQPTTEPHPRHANIINWPGDTIDRLIAVKLAQQSRLVLAPQ